MLNPTYRERTDKFKQLRNSFVSRAYNCNPEANINANGPLLTNTNDEYLINVVPLCPAWMQIVELIDHNITKIQHQTASLKEYHSLRQRVIFDDDEANEYDINIRQITHSITSLLKSSKFKLQEIATNGNVRNCNEESMKLGFEERTARYNAMRSRAIKLQEITKIFRNQQRHFLQQIEKQNKTHKYIDIGDVSQTLPDLSDVYDAENQEQIMRIEEREKAASERERKILEISKSVHELASLLNDLSMLVVEQGSTLDRIDYNVEQTSQTLQNTVPIVENINKTQKRSKTALCIMVLILLIVLCGIILFFRQI